MAKRVEGLSKAEALHAVHIRNDREFFEIMGWIRYQGKGQFDYQLGIDLDPYRTFLDIWFTDAATAFWCKMKFG